MHDPFELKFLEFIVAKIQNFLEFQWIVFD